MSSKLKRFFKSTKNLAAGNLFSVLLFLLIVILFAGGLKTAASAEESESLSIAHNSIMRSLVSCYAIEGRYPESFEYLKQHYPVKIDEEKYIVHYEIFGSNIMPDITVIKR